VADTVEKVSAKEMSNWNLPNLPQIDPTRPPDSSASPVYLECTCGAWAQPSKLPALMKRHALTNSGVANTNIFGVTPELGTRHMASLSWCVFSDLICAERGRCFQNCRR
jgi:hypothetical protein